MLVNITTILDHAKKNKYAVPAFNVYNMETVMGVIKAAEEMKSPVIIQFYSRLATTGFADYLCPVIIKAAHTSSVPVCMHLDHGTGFVPAAIAIKNGCTGIMVDFSLESFEDNIALTKRAVDALKGTDIGVEGELGHIGKACDNVSCRYTELADAVRYVKETGVTALAVMVGTAHGRYKKAPVLAIDRIREISEATGCNLVLHGGSGVGDDQLKKAIKAGITKINFATDLCYAFIESVKKQNSDIIAIDLIMKDPIEAVSKFVKSKMEILGSKGRA